MTGTPDPVPVPVPLLDLTDEELAALAGPPDGLVVAPYLERLEAGPREQAVVTAFRGLVARGLVEAPTAEAAAAARRAGPTELLELEVRMGEELAQALALRRSAGVVLCAQRTVADGTAWRYVHLVDDEVALDEVVGPTGLHRFGLLRPADVPDVLLDWVVPDGADGLDGPATPVGADGQLPTALLERLGTAEVVADLAVRREGDGGGQVLLGTFAGPGLLVLSRTGSAPGSVVTLRRASRGTVREAIAEQLAR